MRNDWFLIQPAKKEDVPVDLLERNILSKQVKIIKQDNTNNSLGALEYSSGYNKFMESLPTVLITLGAFVTIYLIVCEMNKRR